ncbi:MAG TPA: maleylpyruvate isomerase family mycothiol-dependent enzyme [Streptosporangiaceae bacterium]
MSADAGKPDLSSLYLDTYARLVALVAELDAAALATPVPACPGWSVQDVLAHEIAITEDALAGRLTGPPSEEETTAQVARFQGQDIAGMLAIWAQNAPRFAERVATFEVWPAVIDIATHEQDIRGALGRPGARDTPAIRLAADGLIGFLDPPVPIRVSVEDAAFWVGPADGPELGLATCRFEAFRWRMGRRSRAQLAALDWTGDPAPVLDHLTIFGPSPLDIIE